jgi:hypothetical protein
MLIYLLKSSACLGALLLFYKWFLEQENLHVFKRVYLLATIALALGIPAITFTQYIEVASAPVAQATQLATAPLDDSPSALVWALWVVYGLGVCVFGTRFFRNLALLGLKIARNQRQTQGKFTYVLLNASVVPHTFFRYIFVNQAQYAQQQIPQEVLQHEQTHAQQMHSLDVLLLELLQVVAWFNPLVYLLNTSVKLNHEFLADSAVLKQGFNTKAYQNTLLAFASSKSNSVLANSINYSIIKKRLIIMNTSTSNKTVWFKTLGLALLLTGLVAGFSNQVIAQKAKTGTELSPKMLAEYNALAKSFNKDKSQTVMPEDVQRIKYLYGLMSPAQRKAAVAFPQVPPPPPAIPGEHTVTPEMIKEYNALAHSYNSKKPSEMVVKVKDVRRMKHIYGSMSNEQKQAAAPFPNFPPPPAKN